MRKVIVSMFVTLDGFMEGPNGELDWSSADEEMEQYGIDLLSTVDAILLGRVTYQLFAKNWPSATGEGAHKLNTLPKIVFSKTLENAPWGTWKNARLMKDNIAEEILKLKQQPGSDLVIFGGADIVSTFMQL